MIRYELRKNFIYNKIWILLLIVISGIILRSLIPNQQLKSLDNQNYQFYYEKLNGKINQDKIAFLKNEENNINQFKEKSNLLETLYKEGKISDEEYINQLEKINTYHYRAQTFEDINDYVNYLKENKTRSYINENNMNRYLNSSIPFLMIAMIIIEVIISFQNEQSMYTLSKTTIRGKNQLIKSKIFTLILINSFIYIGLSFLNFLLYFDMNYISELSCSLDSTRMFAGTYFHGSILSYILIIFSMQWIAVVTLTYITSVLCLKIRTGLIKLCIVEIGVYLLSFILFTNTKWIYYAFFIGFFNPKRYFLGNINSIYENNFIPFVASDLLIIIPIMILCLLLFFIKRKKQLQIMLLSITCCLISSCQAKENIQTDMMYKNENGFYLNDNVIINTPENQIFDFHLEKKYIINRDVLKDIKDIGTGFMYHQYFYFVNIENDMWTLQRLNTDTFEQIEIYKNSLFKYDILGRIISTSRYNLPNQIYVNNNDIYISYYNRIEVFNGYYTDIIYNKHAQILSIIGNDIFFINDKHQIEKYNMHSKKSTVCVNSLVSSASVVDNYIYFTSLKDGYLYRINQNNNIKQLIINNPVNFFQIVNNQIYYTLIGSKGINSHSFNSNQKSTIVSNKNVYAFLVNNSQIFFTADDSKTNKISWYMYNENNYRKIS